MVVGMILVPTLVPTVAPATGPGVVLGVVTEAGLGEVDAPLGPGVTAVSVVAVASVGLGAATGILDSSIESGALVVGVSPLGGLPEEPAALLELEALLVLSDMLISIQDF